MRHSENRVCCLPSLSSPHGCGVLAITPYPTGISHVSLEAVVLEKDVVLDRPGLAAALTPQTSDLTWHLAEELNRQEGTMLRITTIDIPTE
jgi:hypothetical protein